MAEALTKFYGLPGVVEDPAKYRRGPVNVVTVDDASWARRSKQETQLLAAPMLFVRGGRVYDFRGDRGTVAEFEHDLLVRHVEDDDICRQRRRKQGLLPFPFAGLPPAKATATALQGAEAAEGRAESREGQRRKH